MIKFFRRIRQQLLTENLPNKHTGKFSNPASPAARYLIYAVGEIILVVIGILIALQVNNWNNDKAQRNKEVKYLKNIVLDLEKDMVSLDYLIDFRKNRLLGDQDLIESINGAPINNITSLTLSVVNSMMEERFTPNNSTFTELANSGNLSLISNDSIKILLLELNEIYKINEFGIAHEEFDYREYISKPISQNVDLDKMYPVLLEAKTAEELNISINDFNALFQSTQYKNGLVILIQMHNAFIPAYENMKSYSRQIIETIEKELKT